MWWLISFHFSRALGYRIICQFYFDSMSRRNDRRREVRENRQIGDQILTNVPQLQLYEEINQEELFVSEEPIPAPFCQNLPDDIDFDPHDLLTEEFHYEHELLTNAEGEEYSDEPQPTLQIKIAQWSQQYQITREAGSSLLKLLQPYHPELPLDSRTLLGTLRNVECKNLCGGKYYYFGLINTLKKAITSTTSKHLDLHINVDGLPLYKSSSDQLWPILITVNDSQPLALAIFYGKTKPNDITSYLKDFIDELSETNGQFSLNEFSYTYSVKVFICDAPARSLLKQTIGHNGYYSCERCCVRGQRVENRTVFLETACTARTRVAFDEFSYEGSHQTALTPLIKVVDCVKGFALDYMHLVCLGVMRRMIMFWRKMTNSPAKLSPAILRSLSSRLERLNGSLPSEFVRQPRSLLEVDRWKATEFRTFLLYTGPVVLKGVVSWEYYEHFCSLSLAMNILLEENDDKRNHYLNYAKCLLEFFVKRSMYLYGNYFVTHNVHNLIHLADDCSHFECSLNQLSAFPFENMLGRIKRLVRSPNNPIVELVKKLGNGLLSTIPKQQRLKVSLNPKDSYCQLRNGCLCHIIRIDNKNLYVNVIFSHLQHSLFTLDSTESKLFNITKVSKHSLQNLAVEQFAMDDVMRKVVVLPWFSDENFVAIFPLRHCGDGAI